MVRSWEMFDTLSLRGKSHITTDLIFNTVTGNMINYVGRHVLSLVVPQNGTYQGAAPLFFTKLQPYFGDQSKNVNVWCKR